MPQRYVLAPTLFNIYTNDQPEFPDIHRFLYVDFLCLTTQCNIFETIEQRLNDTINHLTNYYNRKSLNTNPGKNKVCAFYLNNHIDNNKLKIRWNGQGLASNDYPVHVGVTREDVIELQTLKDIGKEHLEENIIICGIYVVSFQ